MIDDDFYDRPMSAWIRWGRGRRWHQACEDVRQGGYVVHCRGTVIPFDQAEANDYRWRPGLYSNCRNPVCNREVPA